ncbi:9077_t:CDS:10 [Entrophospora sp. SA101]|nr:9077_t:CDS:10 [Entrophospora sp. SA101]CAJ0830091.1 11573_t:CDS:10 [Entrophospora sp. SA101]
MEDIDSNMYDPDDTLSILIATDNHLGYLGRDPVCKNDSFETFKEILQIAKDNDVDFILLGGDLFHENKPSRRTVYQTTKLLREFCMGDRLCKFRIVNNESNDLSQSGGINTMNHIDPNFKIAFPVFSIHGNHDDPSGEGNLCALDVLSASGLINYFGKSKVVDKIIIKPIHIQKGNTNLALYGMGNIRDERLHRMFDAQNVEFPRLTEDVNDLLNILVLHQNRVPHGTNYIPESCIPNFFDLVFWGHEHECLIDPLHNSARGFHITQPGSSIATSLCEAEAAPKHVGILKICRGQFRMEKFRLKTIRPMVIDTIVLSEISELLSNDYNNNLINYLNRKANEEWYKLNEHNTNPPLPLIRLKVMIYKFFLRVANPEDILLYQRKRPNTKNQDNNPNYSIDYENDTIEQLSNKKVTDLIDEMLDSLQILPKNGLNQALSSFINKDEEDATCVVYEHALQNARDKILEDPTIVDDIAKKEKAQQECQILDRLFIEDEYLEKLLSGDSNKPAEDSHQTNIEDYFMDQTFSSSINSITSLSTTKAKVTTSTRGKKRKSEEKHYYLSIRIRIVHSLSGADKEQ